MADRMLSYWHLDYWWLKKRNSSHQIDVKTAFFRSAIRSAPYKKRIMKKNQLRWIDHDHSFSNPFSWSGSWKRSYSGKQSWPLRSLICRAITINVHDKDLRIKIPAVPLSWKESMPALASFLFRSYWKGNVLRHQSQIDFLFVYFSFCIDRWNELLFSFLLARSFQPVNE